MARKPPPRLRLRRPGERLDVGVYNDSTGFALWAAGKDGKPVPGLAQGDTRTTAGLTALAEQGLVVPLALAQDDSLTARFLLGESNPREAREWVGRCVWKLSLAHGLLGCNGAVIEVPPGEYLAEVRCYLPHSNAYFCLEWAQKRAADKERLGDYWRRTRPQRQMPRWLVWHLINSPGDDPDCRPQWEQIGRRTREARALRSRLEEWVGSLEQEDGGYVEFLVRLAPLPKRLRMPEVTQYGGWPGYRLPRRVRELLPKEGPCSFVWECRKPTACPLGIPAVNPADAGL